jgi:ubiquinone/menaquinone biosynthesis C-methylase UbiE
MRELKIESATTAFWDAYPCDGQNSHAARAAVRAKKHPWLGDELAWIAARHSNIVEVGCGQGTDCLAICEQMAVGGSYIAVDRSQGSIRSARSAAESSDLNVAPTFVIGDALRLPFEDGAVDCVYSMGVLHHTSDTEQGVREVHRALITGGRAYVALYRANAIKVASAVLLRRLQSASGISFLPLASLLGANTSLGTMLQECFGVPILRSYLKAEIEDLFSAFSDVSAIQRNEFWMVRAVK